MAKYLCIKKCYALDQLFLEGKEYELQPDLDLKYLKPLASRPKVVERTVKKKKPAKLGYERMTETQLVNMTYPLAELRELLASEYKVELPANTKRDKVIQEYVRFRELSRRG